jgi:hypothetical protein
VDRRGGGVGSGYIYNPVREKEHCGCVWRCWCRVSCPKPRLQSGRRNERAVLDFIPSPHRLHSLGSAGRRSRRQWGSACAMRLARSAASCNQGWPGPPKIAQRRRDGWLRSGRRDPGRRRRLGQCVKTRITRRCAVRACFSTALKQGWARARTQTTQGGDMAGLHSSGSQAVNVS